MKMSELSENSVDRYFFSQTIQAPVKRFIRYLAAALILMFAGNAYAVITVGLTIENDLDSNGHITVINGSKVKVAYTVVQDDDQDLNKKDKIQLLRVSDDKVIDSVERGKKKSGSVSLKVKNSEGEQLYVRYIRKNDTQITRTSHPSDPGIIALLSIAKASIADLTVRMNATESAVDNGTLGSLACTGRQYARWDGDAWVCSGRTVKTIPFSVHSAYPFNGGIATSRGPSLKESVAGPGFVINFTVPEDVAVGSLYTVTILFNSYRLAPWVGTVQLALYASSIFKEGIPNDSQYLVIVNPLPTFILLPINPAVQQVKFAFTMSTDLPGTSVFLYFWRDSPDTTFDSFTGDIDIVGVQIHYDEEL